MWFRRKPVELREGEVVELTGTVRALGPLLTAPISGAACVGYEARVRFLVPSFERALDAMIDRVRSSPIARSIAFELELADRSVVVAAEVELAGLAPRTLIPRPYERERAFLEEHRGGAIRLDALTVDEARIEPGDRLAVRGLVAIAPTQGAETGYRECAAQVRVVAPHGGAVEVRAR